MRTVVAPLAPEIDAQLAGLDASLRKVAEGYIARLRMEPFLGHLLRRGLLGRAGARAVYFDRDSRPGELLGEHRGPLRLASEDPAEGPRYRVVYRIREAPKAHVRVVQLLAVGLGHTEPGVDDAYQDADRLLAALLEHERRRKR